MVFQKEEYGDYILDYYEHKGMFVAYLKDDSEELIVHKSENLKDLKKNIDKAISRSKKNVIECIFLNINEHYNITGEIVRKMDVLDGVINTSTIKEERDWNGKIRRYFGFAKIDYGKIGKRVKKIDDMQELKIKNEDNIKKVEELKDNFNEQLEMEKELEELKIKYRKIKESMTSVCWDREMVKEL